MSGQWLRNAAKETERKKEEQKIERDSEKRIVINMNVRDDSEFVSVFSGKSTSVISTDVAEFIESSTRNVPPRNQLTLRIHSDCIAKEEEGIYRSAIREYYTEKYFAVKNELKRNRIIILILALAGILTLSLAFLIEHAIWSEVIDIAAWVLLWEAVDIGVFKNRSMKFDKIRYLTYIDMNVEFYKLRG